MTIRVQVMRVRSPTIINYCYLVIDTETQSAVLIDPAWEFSYIVQQIAHHHADLKGILLTHHHADHVNLAEAFVRRYHVNCYLSQTEINYYQFYCPQLVGITKFTEFNLGSLIIRPLLTPGHTKGSTSYLIGNHFFSGDTLFIEGCGICSTKGGDANAMFETLQEIKQTLSPDTLIYPGHVYGEPVGTAFSYLLNNNVYLHFTDKKEFIQFRMRPGQRNLFAFK